MIVARERKPDAPDIEETEAYWVSHGGQLLLVAPQHLRVATGEERLAHDVIAKLMADFATEAANAERGAQFSYDDLRNQDNGVEAPAPRLAAAENRRETSAREPEA